MGTTFQSNMMLPSSVYTKTAGTSNAGTHLQNRWCFIQEHHKYTKSISYAMGEPEQLTQVSSHFMGWTTGDSLFDSVLGKSFLFSTALWPTMTNSKVHLAYCPQGIGGPKDKVPRE